MTGAPCNELVNKLSAAKLTRAQSLAPGKVTEAAARGERLSMSNAVTGLMKQRSMDFFGSDQPLAIDNRSLVVMVENKTEAQKEIGK